MDIRHVLIVLSSLASAAQALVLGGVNVPKEKVVVYLMIGHSNMAGMDGSHADGTAHPHGWTWQMLSTKTWVPAKETPGTARNGLSTGRGIAGPSMPFLKQMAAAYPDCYFGVVINASQSSTCRGENTGTNGSGIDPDDNRYWKGARLYEEIVTAAKAIQADVTLGGIVCMLGSVEATRTTEATCRNFSNDLAQLARDLRADLGNPKLPFLMGEYEQGASGDFTITRPMPAIIASEIRALPTKLDNSASIPSNGIQMLDDHHYTGNVGQVEFAKRTVAAIQSKGWFPPPSGTTLSISPVRRTAASSQPASLSWSAGRGMAVAADDGMFLVTGTRTPFERTHAHPSH
jgi:hypothetical protein